MDEEKLSVINRRSCQLVGVSLMLLTCTILNSRAGMLNYLFLFACLLVILVLELYLTAEFVYVIGKIDGMASAPHPTHDEEAEAEVEAEVDSRDQFSLGVGLLCIGFFAFNILANSPDPLPLNYLLVCLAASLLFDAYLVLKRLYTLGKREGARGIADVEEANIPITKE
jgi:hypothetical protein